MKKENKKKWSFIVVFFFKWWDQLFVKDSVGESEQQLDKQQEERFVEI